MPQTLKATYSNGTFILQTTCDIPEGSEVELFVKSSNVMAPPISDAESKKSFLKALVKRMQENPIPSDAEPFTRDMLHERR